MINEITFEGKEKDIRALEKLIFEDWESNSYDYTMAIRRVFFKKTYAVLSITITNVKRTEFSLFMKNIASSIIENKIDRSVKIDVNGEYIKINENGKIELDLNVIDRLFKRWDRIENVGIMKDKKTSFMVFIEGNNTADVLYHSPNARRIITEALKEFEVNRYHSTNVYEHSALTNPIKNLYGDNKSTKGKILCYVVSYNLPYEFLIYLNSKLLEYNEKLDGSMSSLSPLVLIVNKDKFIEGDKE